MSISNGLKATAAERPANWPRRVLDNIAHSLALLARPARARRRTLRHEPARIVLWLLLFAAAIAAVMIFVDRPAIEAARRAPAWLFALADFVTDFGQSTWFLVPTGGALILIAALSGLPISRSAQLVLLSIAIRLEFLIAAIAGPSLIASIVKRFIGRARPFVDINVDPFHYMPFLWRSEYAGMPSGHATTVFAAIVAIGALWPRLRVPMWIFALVIAASRVLLTAHYPSDVLAGAAVGILGAWLVRDGFAARGLGFVFGSDGRVHALPGPSFARIKRVARNLIAP